MLVFQQWAWDAYLENFWPKSYSLKSNPIKQTKCEFKEIQQIKFFVILIHLKQLFYLILQFKLNVYFNM